MRLGLEAGVAACTLVFAATGYGLLAPWLRGRSIGEWLSYAGVALMLGAGALGTLLSVLAVAGLRPTLTTCLATAAVVGTTGVLASSGLRPVAGATGARPGPSRGADLVATACCFGLVAVLAAAVVGGLRSSPWLDDTWYFWLPKGLALQQLGLDPRLFSAQEGYQAFANSDYPLWWSIVPALDMSFVGRIDLRAIDAELAVLAAGFFAAVARLLWGRVRPVALWPGLLFAAAAPKLLDLLQSGGADPPNAFYLALAVGGAAGWLATGETLGLLVLVVCGASAASIRPEGAAELLVLLIPAAAILGRSARALGGLAMAGLGACALAAPWYVWQAAHGAAVSGHRHTGHGIEYRIDRLPSAIGLMADDLLDPRRWLLSGPLVVLLSVLLALRLRRPTLLLPALLVAAGSLFWILVLLGLPFNLVGPGLTRTFAPTLVLASACLPLLIEAGVRERTAILPWSRTGRRRRKSPPSGALLE